MKPNEWYGMFVAHIVGFAMLYPNDKVVRDHMGTYAIIYDFFDREGLVGHWWLANYASNWVAMQQKITIIFCWCFVWFFVAELWIFGVRILLVYVVHVLFANICWIIMDNRIMCSLVSAQEQNRNIGYIA